MVVIFASALLTGSLRAAFVEPVGFDMENLLALRIEAPAELGNEPGRIASFLRQVGERAQSTVPGDAAALAYAGPFGSRGGVPFLRALAATRRRDRFQPPLAGYRLVSRNYFDVLGIPVLRGRSLPAPSAGRAPGRRQPGLRGPVLRKREPRRCATAVPLGAAAAARSFPGHRGRDRRRGRGREILAARRGAVAPGVREHRIGAPERLRPARALDRFRRAHSNDSGPSSPRCCRELPGVPIDHVRRIEDSARATVWGRWLGVAVMDLLAILALALVTTGVYGVLSSAVHERRRELAIRSALGAPSVRCRGSGGAGRTPCSRRQASPSVRSDRSPPAASSRTTSTRCRRQTRWRWLPAAGS